MLTHLNHSPTKPARAVILGARGFVSTYLQSWCKRNKVPFLAISSDEVDLTRIANAPRLAALLDPKDAVVMTSSIQPDKGRDYHALMANLRMVETACMALEAAPCAQFICLSSDAVYDASKIPLDEDSTREPVDIYGLSHVAREMIVSSALGQQNLPVCILRITAIYGPGDTHNGYGPNRFVRSAIKEGRIVLFGRGEERRSHVYIDDVAEIIGRCLRWRSAGKLNVAVRQALSYKEIAEEAVRLVGGPVEITYAPRTVPIVHKPYKPTQVFRFLYNLGRPISPIVHRTFVNSALFAAFPDFKFTPFEAGLAAFVASERDRMSGETSANVNEGIGMVRS